MPYLSCYATIGPVVACLALGGLGCSGSGGSSSASPPSERVVTLASGLSYAQLAVDDESVYAVIGQDGIRRYPLDGGAPVQLAGLSADTSVQGMVRAGSSLYLSTLDYGMGATAQGSIVVIPVAGGSPQTLFAADGGIGAIGTDGTTLYGAVTDTGAACAPPSCEGLVAVPLAGGAPVTITTTSHAPSCFAFDASDVYWGSSDGVVSKAPKAGGAGAVLADFASTAIEALELEGSTLTWGASGGDVYQTPAAGGASKPIEVSSGSMASAAFASQGLVWSSTIDLGSGVVLLTALGGSTSTLWSSSGATTEQVDALAASGSTAVALLSSGALLRLGL